MNIDHDKRNAAWKARLERTLPEGCKLDLVSLLQIGKPVRVTIAADPPEFAEPNVRSSELCPVCGGTTLNLPRVGATLDVKNACGWGVLVGVWAHTECLENCPVLGPANNFPW